MAEVVATYSIAACDLEARQWGVATQSKFLGVGSVVPWAEPHVGAVATQAYANPRYGPDGLALLREGKSAEEVVQALTDADDGRDHRQLGVVDREGGSASYTGSECMDWAGGRTGSCYAAQGNILVSAETVDAIAETCASTSIRSRSRSCAGSTSCTRRSSAGRRSASGSRWTASSRRSCATVSRRRGSRASWRRRSRPGPGRRTSRSALTESSVSIRSCSRS